MSARRYERVTGVEIVRPDSGWTDAVVKLLDVALSTWLAMLALGALTSWHPGFWDTLLGVYALRSVLGTGNYVYWSRPRKRIRS